MRSKSDITQKWKDETIKQAKLAGERRLKVSKTICCGKPFKTLAFVICSQCGDDGRGI